MASPVVVFRDAQWRLEFFDLRLVVFSQERYNQVVLVGWTHDLWVGQNRSPRRIETDTKTKGPIDLGNTTHLMIPNALRNQTHPPAEQSPRSSGARTEDVGAATDPTEFDGDTYTLAEELPNRLARAPETVGRRTRTVLGDFRKNFLCSSRTAFGVSGAAEWDCLGGRGDKEPYKEELGIVFCIL